RLCFFFQAEDGIRDFHVTGVQTCALPISPVSRSGPATLRVKVGRKRPSASSKTTRPASCRLMTATSNWPAGQPFHPTMRQPRLRSEERRVGKERRDRGSRYAAQQVRAADE